MRAGEPAAAEEWAGPGGPLAVDEDLAVELVFTEYVTREELGHAPTPAEYYDRFPALADRLCRLFGVDRLLHESADQAATTGAGRARGDTDRTGKVPPRPAPR